MKISSRNAVAQTRAGGTKQIFDIIIGGGGSAGAVLAARLSADAQRRVLLLEAGQNFAPDRYRPVLTDANVVAGSPDFDWHYHTEDSDRLGHDVPVPRGRVIGGGSAVNAAVAMRARPADFARWAKRGIEGWPWDEVLDACKALENTLTGDDVWHARRPAPDPPAHGRGEHPRRCVPSLKPRKLSACCMYPISTARPSTAARDPVFMIHHPWEDHELGDPSDFHHFGAVGHFGGFHGSSFHVGGHGR